MFGGEKKKSAWKMEYEDAVYKIYDWNRNLAAYFFPNYPLEETTENEDEIIDKLNKSHQSVRGGSILFPMVKLNILDKEEGIGLDYAIFALEESLKRIQIWKQWLLENNNKYEIVGNSVYTSREDREMLSIALGINSDIVLGEKETLATLTPLLDGLHDNGLL